jgi:hypothetical protein
LTAYSSETCGRAGRAGAAAAQLAQASRIASRQAAGLALARPSQPGALPGRERGDFRSVARRMEIDVS